MVVFFVKLTFVKRGPAGQTFIQIMQITNKIIRRMHWRYAVLYMLGTLTSVGFVSADEGTCAEPQLEPH